MKRIRYAGCKVFVLAAILSVTMACNHKKATETVATTTKGAEAISQLDAKIAANPADANLYFLRAKAYVDKKDMPNAFTDITKAISLDSLKPAYYLTLSDVYFASVQTRKSKEALEKCISIDKNNVDANLKLAELYLYVKENKRSVEYVDNVLKLDVHNPKAYFIKGMNFKELKDTARAISSFQTVVEQNPDYYNAYMQLAILSAHKKSPLTLQYLATALKLNPKSTEAYYARAMFYQAAGDYATAKENYKTILQIDPTYKNAYFNQGYIALKYEKKYDDAIDLFGKAINVDVEFAKAYYMRGLSYESKGNKAQAAADYKKALTIAPEFDLAKKKLSN